MHRRRTDQVAALGSTGRRRAAALLRSLRDSLDADSVALARTVAGSYVMVATSDPGEPTVPQSLPWERTLCHLHATGGAPALTLDAAADPVYGPLVRDRALPVRSFLTVPVAAEDGSVLARLSVYDSRPGRRVLLERAVEVRAVAEVLGTLLEQQDALDALDARATAVSVAAEHDALTGVLDRNGWARSVQAAQSRLDRSGGTAVLAALRPAAEPPADALAGWLGSTTRTVAATLRGGDVIARTGSTEISLLVHSASTETAGLLRRRLLTALEDAPGDWEVVVAVAPHPVDLTQSWESLLATLPTTGPADPRRVALPVADIPAQTTRSGDAPAAPARPSLGDLLSDGPLASGTAPGLRLQMLLEAFARHLGMTMAYISELDEERMELKYTWTAPGAPELRPGLLQARVQTYCAAMLDGHIPQAVPDTRESPVLRRLPATSALPIGSYLGAPVVLSDGRVHGSICAFRETPHPDLGPGHAALLDAVASAVAGLLEEELVATERRTMLCDMVDAVVATGGPRMVFQPVVSLANGTLLGSEALARFDSPDPSSVFSAVTDIDPDDRLQRAAVTAAVRSLDRVSGFLAVNLSARALLAPATLAMLAGMDLSRLVVEVSEHEAVEDYARLAAALAPLRADGLRLAVDDAGAGFASLRHVLRLAPDVVKLDIAMVRGLTAGSSQAALLDALATFAADSDILLVAEGVETEAELAALLQVGVHAGQGYLLGRPAPMAAA